MRATGNPCCCSSRERQYDPNLSSSQYEKILQLCDELGLYVELEAGPHIVTKWAPTYYERYETLDDPGMPTGF